MSIISARSKYKNNWRECKLLRQNHITFSSGFLFFFFFFLVLFFLFLVGGGGTSVQLFLLLSRKNKLFWVTLAFCFVLIWESMHSKITKICLKEISSKLTKKRPTQSLKTSQCLLFSQLRKSLDLLVLAKTFIYILKTLYEKINILLRLH